MRERERERERESVEGDVATCVKEAKIFLLFNE